jgi:AraC-like DNA-binding protein
MWLEQISPRLNALWRGPWPMGYVEPARYLYDHELICFMQGRVQMRIGRREHGFEAGEFVIVAPDTYHVSVGESRLVQRACVHFDWTCPATARPAAICAYHPQRPGRDEFTPAPAFVPRGLMSGRFDLKGEVPGLLSTLFHRWQSGDAHERALGRGVFLEMLVRLLWPRSGPAKPAPDGRRLQLAYAVKDLLDRREEEPGADESVQHLLASLGFSYPHLCRLFRQTFGVTPVGYLNARKLERAKTLLRDPAHTVSEVAYASGFQDVGYFVRKFKEQNGVSPGKFREGL